MPVSVSGVGVREAFLSLVFPALGLAAAHGVAYGLVVFAVIYLTTVLIGFIAWQVAPPPFGTDESPPGVEGPSLEPDAPEVSEAPSAPVIPDEIAQVAEELSGVHQVEMPDAGEVSGAAYLGSASVKSERNIGGRMAADDIAGQAWLARALAEYHYRAEMAERLFPEAEAEARRA